MYLFPIFVTHQYIYIFYYIPDRLLEFLTASIPPNGAWLAGWLHHAQGDGIAESDGAKLPSTFPVEGPLLPAVPGRRDR